MCVLESLCPPVVRPTDSFRILTDPPSSSRKVAYVCVRAASRDSTTVPRLFEPLLFLFLTGLLLLDLALRFSFIWPGPSSFLLRCAPYSSLRLLFLHHAAAATDRDFRQLKFRSGLNTLADDNHMDIHPPVSLSLGCCPPRSFLTELFCNYHNFNCRRTQHTITHLSLNVQPLQLK